MSYSQKRDKGEGPYVGHRLAWGGYKLNQKLGSLSRHLNSFGLATSTACCSYTYVSSSTVKLSPLYGTCGPTRGP
ncbi:hypothetical protein K439DRAFT_1053444 [Ramaria rubella]|nr:hypothetical protein K439DRAFT_1053444 [Ramaria rubella]